VISRPLIKRCICYLQIYLLDTNTNEADEDAYEWMAEFQDFMENNADEYESVFGITYITSRSIDDALEESVSGEISLFVATCAFWFSWWRLLGVIYSPTPTPNSHL